MYSKALYLLLLPVFIGHVSESLECLSVPKRKIDGTIVDCSGQLRDYSVNAAIETLPSDTVILNLQTNDLDECRLDPAAFRHLTRLRTLDLSNNNLRAFDLHEMFLYVPSLRELNLTQNALTSLSNDSQTNCDSNDLTVKIKGINVDGRELVQSTQTPPPPLPPNDHLLTNLYLDRNFLDQDDLHALNDLTDLRVLHLSFNRIQLIDGSHLSALTQLEDLKLGENSITRAEFSYPDLGELDLSNNEIREIPVGMFNTTNRLYSLHLQGNEIGTVLHSGSFIGLQNLDILDLSDNRITSLPRQFFEGMAQLRELYLDDNSLTELSSGLFEPVTNLELLSLSGNSFRTIMNELHPLSKLQNLYLGNNRIADIAEDAFMSMSDLKSIQLEDNRLQLIPAALNNPSLKRYLFSISLSHNYIQEINGGDLNTLRELKVLRLDKNQIGEIDPIFFRQLTSLTVVTLNDNDLWYLPDGTLEPLMRTQVSLFNNPWFCNCSLNQLWDYYQRRLADAEGLNDNLTCRSYEGTGSQDLSITQWGEYLDNTCSGKIGTPILITIILLALLFIVMTVGLFWVIYKRCGQQDIPSEGVNDNRPPAALPVVDNVVLEHPSRTQSDRIAYLSIHEEGSNSLYYSQPYAQINKQVILQIGKSDETADYTNVKPEGQTLLL